MGGREGRQGGEAWKKGTEEGWRGMMEEGGIEGRGMEEGGMEGGGGE